MMIFVLGSVVFFFAVFFGFIAKQIQGGTEKHESVASDKPSQMVRRAN